MAEDDAIIELNERIEAAKEDTPKYEGIAVCGSHPATVEKAPFDDPKWLIYACSPHNVEHRSLPRVDEWFEIHQPIQDATRSYHYLRSLEQMGVRVWMRPKDDLDRLNMAWFKEAREYPEAELKRKYGRLFWVGSIAHIMYKAIDDCIRMQIPAIGIYGALQMGREEYEAQLPSTQYTIELARMHGIRVFAPPEAQNLFTPKEALF